MTAFDELESIYADRGKCARALHDKGEKVIGYFCCYVPEEIITAMGMVPFRIQGSQSIPIDEADAYIEPTACPFARSCFNLALKGEYDFLDGFVAPHSCDTVERLYHIWRHNKPASFNHYINVPHMMGPTSEVFYKKELAYFIKCLEDWSGRKMDMGKLKEAIRLSNERRAALRDLYDLRKADPPLISGTEMTKILVAGMSMPVAEHMALVRRLASELKDRAASKSATGPRIFLWGNEIDDVAFVQLVEESGAHVVMDDLCTGTRSFWDDIPETVDPLEGMAAGYLAKHCPRSNTPQTGSRAADLETRYGYIGNFIKEWKTNGAIFYIVRYCDTCELEGPDLREYLNAFGIPVLMIEDDYSISTIGQLRTRIQAFLEMIG